jgi:hypothetical protein
MKIIKYKAKSFQQNLAVYKSYNVDIIQLQYGFNTVFDLLILQIPTLKAHPEAFLRTYIERNYHNHE